MIGLLNSQSRLGQLFPILLVSREELGSCSQCWRIRWPISFPDLPKERYLQRPSLWRQGWYVRYLILRRQAIEQPLLQRPLQASSGVQWKSFGLWLANQSKAWVSQFWHGDKKMKRQWTTLPVCPSVSYDGSMFILQNLAAGKEAAAREAVSLFVLFCGWPIPSKSTWYSTKFMTLSAISKADRAI